MGPTRRSKLLYFFKNTSSWTLQTATVAQTVNVAVAVTVAVTVTVAGEQHIPTAIVLGHAHVARNLPATAKAQAVTVARKFPTSPASVKEQVATVANDLLTVTAWGHAHVAGNM